jgi:hypothetical protein
MRYVSYDTGVYNNVMLAMHGLCMVPIRIIMLPLGSAWPLQLDCTVGGIKPISEGHSLISLSQGPIQIFVRRGPIQIAENRRKSPKIAPPAAAAVVWPRARQTHIVKNR